MKVASLGAGLDVRQLGIAPRLGIPESAAPALQRAITDGRVARFDYLLPTRERSHGRRVAPVRLHRAEGRWHLIAFDLERREYRVFLLSRITSEVRVSRDEFDVDLFDGVEETLVELQALADTQRAEVSVRRGSAAESRLAQRSSPRETSDGHDPGFVTLEIGTLDWHALAEELASFGGDVRVQAPPSLRRMVVEVLDLIRAQHLDGGTDA
jgi:proteasome accessory factor B